MNGFRHDSDGRLINSYDDQFNFSEYRYDALGRRIYDWNPYQVPYEYTYDGHDVLVSYYGGSPTKYQNGPGIDNKLQSKTGSTVRYFLADHLGSTNGLADATGSLTSQTGYDSFGNPTNSSFPSRYQFTGREYDSFAGLQYSRARFYDPKIGRFISEDPTGFGGGDINLYGYVWNSPLGYVDPLGLNGWGTNVADWLDRRILYAENYWAYNEQEWVANGINRTIADVAYGFSDMFRVGTGIGQAIYCEGLPDHRRFELVANDVVRGGSLFLTMVGPFAGRPSANRGATRGSLESPNKLPYTKGRPSYGRGQVDEVWRNAADDSGRVFDPYTGEELFWNKSKPRNGQWDMGHRAEIQYRDYHRLYMEGRITKQEFLRIHRDPQNYHPQSVRSNRGRRFD